MQMSQAIGGTGAQSARRYSLPLRVFYSYAHEDESLRQKLETHLSGLERGGKIQEWHDHKITAGRGWERAIEEQLEAAHIILLLVSADFVASDYCYGKELRRALERDAAGEARVIPIIVRPVDWEGVPFRHLQALPRGARPVTSWANQDEAWADVASGIREAINELAPADEGPVRPPPTSPPIVPDAGDQPLPPERGQIRSARVGLDALIQLMEAPEVRAAVVAFQADFKAACEQIGMLGDYKDLHDRLHDLRLRCYSNIIREAESFQSDEAARERLADLYQLDVQRVIDGVQMVADRGVVVTGETPWIRDLVQAGEMLGGAIEHVEPDQLKKAIRLLNRVLSVQPSLNTRLNAAARALRLPALVEGLTRVRNHLARPDLDPDKVQQFGAGGDALDSLHDNLTALVNEHDQWQLVDLELRRIEAELERDPDVAEVELSWPSLKAMAEPLYREKTDAKSMSIKAEGDKLESAIATQDPARMRQAFRRYRQQADERFYRVDATLKRLCDELRKVGEPLAAVLRTIG